MGRKKSEILGDLSYWLGGFENEFIRDFERLGKKVFTWEKYEQWQKAVTLYVRVYDSIHGVEPPYNSRFMQAVAVSGVCDYTFTFEWPERKKVAS